MKVFIIILLLTLPMSQSFGQAQSKKNFIFVLQSIQDSTQKIIFNNKTQVCFDAIKYYSNRGEENAKYVSCDFIGKIIDIKNDTLYLEAETENIFVHKSQFAPTLSFQPKQVFKFPLISDTTSEFVFRNSRPRLSLLIPEISAGLITIAATSILFVAPLISINYKQSTINSKRYFNLEGNSIAALSAGIFLSALSAKKLKKYYICNSGICLKNNHYRIKKNDLPDGELKRKQFRKFMKEYKRKLKSKIY